MAACFEITAGWRICAAPAAATAERAAAQTPGPCATGAAVPDAVNNPGLVADCAILLTAKDTLRGTAALNWDPGLAILAWDGVTVRGTPPRVTELRLEERALTGTIPAVLGDPPRLTTLRLAQNRLTGCLPRELTQVPRNDLDRLGLDPCELPSTTLTYGAPSTTGTITDDGDYAFLTDPDDLTTAITTYEGLRTGLRDGTTIGLVMHQNDGDGASHEAFYDLVEANDVVEWREAADCWMRYVIREVHADPTGDPPRKLLTLQIYSHADTGCSGTLGPTGTRTFTWTPESIRTGTIQTFFTHGAFVVVPEGWTGTRPTVTSLPMIDTPWPPDPIPAPDLGDGWQGGIDHDSYTDALYIRFSRGNERVRGYIYRLRAWPRDIISHSNNPGPRTARNEWGVLDGRPVEIATPGLGVTSHFVSDVAVYVYDPATGLLYVILVEFNPPPGADPIEAAIDLVRKFLPAAHASSCQPRAPAGGRSNDSADLGLEDCGLPSTTLTYGAPVTTGAVTDDGDYAFLTDPGDLTSAITTYEGLRDGLRKGNPIGLVMHQNDISGASQADFYDLVEAGDIVEWREADGCWMRYVIREVHADPRGYPPRTLLTIQVYSYAFTGCTSGPITTRGTRTFTWTPETIRTGNITVPFYHGSSLIAPEGWTGTLPDRERITPIAPAWPPEPLPAPDLGPGWSGSVSASGGDDGYALWVWYRHESGGELDGMIQRLHVWPRHVSFHTNTPAVNQGIYEWILIDGRPAEVVRRRHDSEGAPRERVGVSIYDAATGVGYWIGNGYQPPFSGPEVMIELARQFLPDAHPSSCQPRALAGGRSNDVADLGLEDCGLPVLTLGYVAPSTTGAITDDGDYAFLSDPNDLTSAITTYEGLRDGLREGNPIGLVLHQNDDRGISQAAFYDLVRVGDLVEWRDARGCWVRYQVTEVHPDPPGAPPRKLLTIQVYSYAAADWCSGVLPPPHDHERQLFIWE